MGNGSSKKVNKLANIDPNAERVDLRNKNIKNIKKLPVMVNLKWLNLSNNEIKILPPQMSDHFPLLQSLRLAGNQIHDIPPSFLELKNLRMLDLGKNNFTVIPETLLLITSLKDLNMQMNKISSIPANFSNLTNLQILNLSINCISSVKANWESLVLLETLDLSHNQLTELDDSFVSLTCIRSLYISGNDIKSIPPYLKLMTSLKSLDIRFNEISQLYSEEDDASLLPKSLTSIKLRNNNMKDLKGIESLINLEEAHFEYNMFTNIIDSIGNLEKITTLFLYKNGIESIPESIGNLIYLKDLDLSMNKIKELPLSISRLTNLICLTLNDNNITRIEEESFKGLPSLTTLALGYNKLKTIPESITNLTSLSQIDLSANIIDFMPMIYGLNFSCVNLGFNKLEEIPKFIFSLQNLIILNLFGNELETIPDAIGNLSGLNKLNFSYNSLNTLPETLSNINSLTELNIDGNQFSTIPTVICNLPNLRHLSMNNNKITEIPECIQNLTNLKYLYISVNLLRNIDYITSIVSLVELDVSHNFISKLPDSMSRLSNIQSLDISGNLIKSVSLHEFKSLIHLNAMFNNPYLTLPNDTHIWFVDPNIIPRRTRCKQFSNILQPCQKIIKPEIQKRLENATSINEQPEPEVDELKVYYRHYLGWSCSRGRRPEMQDTLAIYDTFHFTDIILFGLFDGHSGSQTSELCAKILKEVSMRFISLKDRNNQKNLEKSLVNIVECLHRSVESRKYDDGTASLIGLIVNTNKLLVNNIEIEDDEIRPFMILANSGDERAVICRNGEAIAITKDHKPDDDDERRRIKNIGGYVSESNRVNGVLALSRAIGDVYLQPYVTYEPDIFIEEITDDIEFIIIACDGLWDSVSSEKAVELIRYESDCAVAACVLKDYAYSLNSGDNISVIVIRFKDPPTET